MPSTEVRRAKCDISAFAVTDAEPGSTPPLGFSLTLWKPHEETWSMPVCKCIGSIVHLLCNELCLDSWHQAARGSTGITDSISASAEHSVHMIYSLSPLHICGRRISKAPYPFPSAKLGEVPSIQYCVGDLCGNLRCFGSFFSLSLRILGPSFNFYVFLVSGFLWW